MNKIRLTKRKISKIAHSFCQINIPSRRIFRIASSDFKDRYNISGFSDLNNLFNLYYDPLVQFDFNTYIVFLEQVHKILEKNPHKKKDFLNFYNANNILIKKVENYLHQLNNYSSSKDDQPLKLGSLLRFLLCFDDQTDLNLYIPLLEYISYEKHEISKYEVISIIFSIEKLCNIDENKEITEILESCIKTLSKSIYLLLKEENLTKNDIFTIIGCLTKIKSEETLFLIKLAEIRLLFETKSEHFEDFIDNIILLGNLLERIYLSPHILIDHLEGRNETFFWNELDPTKFLQMFNIYLIHFSQIKIFENNYIHLILKYQAIMKKKEYPLNLPQINKIFINYKTLNALDESLFHLLLEKACDLNQILSLNAFYKFLQFMMDKNLNISQTPKETILKKLNILFLIERDSLLKTNNESEMKDICSILYAICFILEENECFEYFWNLINTIPFFVVKNIFHFDFEKMCFFYVICLKYNYLIINDRKEAVKEMETLKEYIKITYFSNEKTKIYPYNSWYYEILKYANFEEFYNHQDIY